MLLSKLQIPLEGIIVLPSLLVLHYWVQAWQQDCRN